MPRLTKIYTKLGDEGTTSLGNRQRVAKDSLRVQAYGEVDELNSTIGVAIAHGLIPRLAQTLIGVQNELFNIGAQLAFPNEDEAATKLPTIAERHLIEMEAVIDEMLAVVGPLENFVLPGGSKGASFLHLARAICRRAERSVVHLARTEQVDPNMLKYLNRLSDALFVMALFENHEKGVAESLWDTQS
jgi:cob(I)alamin adenosyltransferase